MEIHKINVNKSDEVSLIAEKIIDAKHKEILLNIPKFSNLSESASNLRLLKREAEALGKKIIIESVDDKVIEFCKAIGIECLNPFFTESQRQFSDIVTGKAKREIKYEIAEQEKINLEDQKPKPQLITTRSKSRERKLVKLISLFVIAVALIGGGLFLGLEVIPKADIKIAVARTEWSYKDSIHVNKSITAPDPEGSMIPGQIFAQKKNLQLSFPASGKKEIAAKAKGQIIIYNSHSSSPQSLVARTRFAAPDGKIFRLVQGVTVPGAKVEGGEIKPSSIEVQVIADKSGEAYNIGPVTRFTIPGFAGSPKFNTFYGESKDSMTGGFIGEAAYPTDEDIKKSKAVSTSTLEESIKNLLIAQLTMEFKLIDGALEFKLVKQTVNTEVDSERKFSILSEADVSAVVFKEQDLFNMLLGKIHKDAGSNFEVKDYKLSYGVPQINLEKGQLSFPIDYQSMLAKKIDIELLKEKVAGKSESELKTIIFSVPGLVSAKISLWPFWVRAVTRNTSRINIIEE